MGLQLPPELVTIINLTGRSWPESDEEKLFDLSRLWTELSGTLETVSGGGDHHAQSVALANSGQSIAAFHAKWGSPDAPALKLQDGSVAASGVGVGLIVMAIVVLMLKIYVVIQLIILAIQIAQAVLTAGPTFGASLAEIPLFKLITSLILDQLLNVAIMAVLGG